MRGEEGCKALAMAMARLGVPVGGRVRMLRALEDRQGRPVGDNYMVDVMRGGDRG